MTRVLSLFAFLLPFTFSWALYDTFDGAKLALLYVVVFVVLLFVARKILSEKTLILRWTGLEIPLLLFAGVAGISTLQSIDPEVSVGGIYRVYTFGLLPMLAMMGLFAWSVQMDRSRVRAQLVWAIILAGAGVGAYAWMQYQGLEPFEAMPRVEGGRPWASVGNPIYLGTVCMLALLVTVFEWLERRRWHALYGFCVLAQITGLFLSLSRSAWVGMLAGLLVGLLMRRRPSFKALMVVVGFVGLLFLLPITRTRVLSIVQPGEASNTARIEGWKGALHIWRDHPVWGTGPDTFLLAFRPYRTAAYLKSGGLSVTQAHAHNDTLQVVSTMGALGLGAWILILLVLARSLRGAPPLLVACAAALFVHNQFNFSSLTTTAWMALLFGVWLPVRERTIRTRAAYAVMAVGMALGLVWFVTPRLRADYEFRQTHIAKAIEQPVQALVHVREAVRLFPGQETYLMEQGNIARTLALNAPEGSLRQDLLLEAWQSAETAARLHPHNPDAWNNLGVVAMWRIQIGKDLSVRPQARQAFEKAIALDPVFVDAWANLAKWHHEAGDIPSELKTWQHVLRLNPAHPMAHQVLHAL